MAKAKAWQLEFKRLLAPQLLTALKDDRVGKIPLRATQRRQMNAMLRIVMTADQIRKAIGPAKRKAAHKRHRT